MISMMKHMLYYRNKADNRFNPHALKDFLIRSKEGEVIVDRKNLIKNDDDLSLFCIVLNKDYGWDYSCPDTTTLFFEVDNERIIGGVYEIDGGTRTKKVIAVPRDRAKEYDYRIYSYEKQDFDAIVKQIQNAK